MNYDEIKHKGSYGRGTRKKGRPKLPKITAQQMNYVRAKVETGSHQKALEIAGYAPNSRMHVNKNVKVHLERLQKEVSRKFIDRAEKMADNMYDLALGARSEQVRFQATKDYLDRAGFQPTQKTEVENKFIPVESQVSRDLIDRLNNIKDGSKQYEDKKENKGNKKEGTE